MQIIEKSYKWKGNLSKRKVTKYIIFHHMAGKGRADDLHRIHLNNGWAGIGYHFFVRSDGSVYRGRPIDTVGAQTSGYNSESVGICFEGNFETDKMTSAQLKSGFDLATELKSLYPNAVFKRHKDLNATACPGKNFPFEKMTKSELTDAPDIVASLSKRGIMTDTSLWKKKCTDDKNAYWLARKICNMTIDINTVKAPVTDADGIVRVLNQRGIILDTPRWLKLLNTDTALYHLAYKAANLTENEVM